jgi:hypothetical protein
VAARLPGDDLLPDSATVATRAMTIPAPAAEIWRWLVQMGFGRAGWYTYQWFEKSLPWLRRMGVLDRGYYERWTAVWKPNADRAIPELQELHPGDTVLDGPPGTAYFKVTSVEPGRSLVLYSIRHPLHGHWPDAAALETGVYYVFGWAFVLEPVDERTTRLIIRTRVECSRQWWLPWVTEALVVPMDALMQRGMLDGVRKRSRRQPPAASSK